MADTSSLLTRCPHCDTRFRVTGEQLTVANGKVRCGHCMEVFDARTHADSHAKDGGAGPSEEGAESFSATDPEDDLVFEDNPEEDAAEGPYAGKNLNFSDDELSDSFRGFGDHASLDSGDDDELEEVDESWAEAMLEEEEAPALRTDSVVEEPEPAPRPPSPPEESAPASSSVGKRPPSPPVKEPGHKAAARAEAQDPPIDESADYELEAHDGKRESGGTFPALDDLSPYEQLSREPVSVRSGGGRSWRGWFWALVVLALLAALVSQVAWFQVDRLAAIPELRPWYEKACEYAGCELEPLVAMDRIQSRKLVVRTDPEKRDALLVDAVIINQAEFEQPFPSIALTFSNLNGDVVAQSVFPPEEYLAGDGADLEAMPSGTPVRIAISIRDPGRDAVNYNLRFVNRRD